MTIKDVLQMREAIANYYATEFYTGAIITSPTDIAHFAAAKFGGSRIEHIWGFKMGPLANGDTISSFNTRL